MQLEEVVLNISLIEEDIVMFVDEELERIRNIVRYKKDIKIDLDASQDLEIFCDRIAPGLNISVRFVGEEPEDRITEQYNEYMKKILPYYQMKLVEIPRLEHSGKVISASAVRKYLKEGKLEEVQKYMSDEAYRILLSKKAMPVKTEK